MRNRLLLAGAALGALAVIAFVVVGAFALSDRIADEAIERAPIPRTTSTPVPTAPPVFVAPTPAPEELPEVVTSFMREPDRQFAAGVVLADGRVLVVGGQRSNFLGGLFIPPDAATPRQYRSAVLYDPRTNEWTEVTPPTSSRALANMLLRGDGKVVLSGGFGSLVGTVANSQARLEEYDWLTGQWSRLNLPSSTLAVAIFEIGGRLHAVTYIRGTRSIVNPGGSIGVITGPAAGSGRVQTYDPVMDAWSEVSELATGRDPLGALPLADGRIVVWMEQPSDEQQLLFFGSGVRTADPGQIEYIIVDPSTGQRSGVRILQAPPYRPRFATLPDGGVLVFGGSLDDPSAWEAAVLEGLSSGPPVNDPPPELPPEPTPNEMFFRLDPDSGVLEQLEPGAAYPTSSFLLEGTLYSTLLPTMAMTEEGLDRLLEALQGRSGPLVLAIDDHRALVAGGSQASDAVVELAESVATFLEGSTGFDGSPIRRTPPEPDFERLIVDAGLDAPDLRYARPDAVIIRVN